MALLELPAADMPVTVTAVAAVLIVKDAEPLAELYFVSDV